MFTQLSTPQEGWWTLFKLNFQGISALLEKPILLLEVGEAKGNVSPTSLQTESLGHHTHRSEEWMSCDGGITFNTEALPNCLLTWMERNTVSLNLVKCYVRSYVLSGFVYVADGFAKKNYFFLYGEAGNHHQILGTITVLDGLHPELRLILSWGRHCPDCDDQV